MPVPTSGCSCMLCYTDRIGIGGAAILTNRFSRCQCHWCAIFDVYIGQWSFCIIYDYLPTSHGSAPFNRIWNITILRSPKQQIWLRTALCGGWCRRMALRNRELHARNDDDPEWSVYKVCCALLYALWHHDIYDDVDDALFRKLAAFSHLVLMVSLELIHQIALVLHQVAPMLLKLRCSWPATNNNMVAPAVLCQFHRLPFTVANTVIIKHNWYSLNEWMTLYTLGP